MLAGAQQQATDDATVQGVEPDAVQTQHTLGARVIAHAAASATVGTRRFLTMLGLHCLAGYYRLRSGADRELRAHPQAGARLAIAALVGAGGRWWCSCL